MTTTASLNDIVERLRLLDKAKRISELADMSLSEEDEEEMRRWVRQGLTPDQMRDKIRKRYDNQRPERNTG